MNDLNELTGYMDTHAHYSDEAFDADRFELIEKLFGEKVLCIIDPAVDRVSSEKVVNISERFSGYYCAVGIHPHNASDAGKDDIDKIAKLIRDDRSRKYKKIVAVGETGLDYHYMFSSREIQIDNFRKNIRLALEYKLPVIVHDREAHADTLNVLLEENAFEGKVLYHCYSGSAEYAAELLKYGCMFSFGGTVTFKNAKKFESIFNTIPAGSILTETDSPYMSPEPVRGTRNDSSNLRYIYPVLAGFLKMDEHDFAETMIENTKRFFEINI